MSTVDETALRDRLRDEGLGPSAWGNEPHDRYGAHDHGYDKVIVVAAGSIRFGLPGTGGGHDLVAGDRLELPAGTTHDAVVGPDGVTCLEAHLPAGALQEVAARRAGSW
jgi:quercetin dioxygenase-like cupin family protein